MTHKFTPQQIENIREAIKMWETVPPENVAPRLGFWRDGFGDPHAGQKKPPTCGTVACFGGWLAWWPAFRAQGVEAWDGGAPYLTWASQPWAYMVSRELFGDDDMFDSRDLHKMDHNMPVGSPITPSS